MIKELIQEFAKHSREYHTLQEDAIRGKRNLGNENMDEIIDKLENIDPLMTKMD